MPSVNVITRNSTGTYSAEFGNGGCFGFMAQGYGFFSGHKENTTHLFYRLEGADQENNCRSIFDGNNPFFPYHTYMSTADYRAWLREKGINPAGSLQIQGNGYIMVEMQPEGFEGNGIPQDMFISGLFTARNLANIDATGESRYLLLQSAAEGVHPMLGYILLKSFTVTATIPMRFSLRNQRESSSNLDMWTFDKANMRNALRKLLGQEHTPYFGTVGGILQNNGYKRDHNYNEQEDMVRTHILRQHNGRVTANMNTTFSPIPIEDSSELLVYPEFVTYNYLRVILSELAGQDVLKPLDGLVIPTYAPGAANAKFFESCFGEKRPRYRRNYKVGDVVGIRKDAIGSEGYDRALFSSGRINSSHTKAFETGGVVPLIGMVEAVDESRVECIKLVNGTWVHPRYIILLTSKSTERLLPPDDFMDNPVAGMMVTRNGRDGMAYLRSYDPFSSRGYNIIYPDVVRDTYESSTIAPSDFTVVDYGVLKAAKKAKKEKEVKVTDAMKRAAKAVAAGKKAIQKRATPNIARG